MALIFVWIEKGDRAPFVKNQNGLL